MINLAETLIAWLSLFVAIGGAALCVPLLARSKWARVVTGAFAEASALAFYRMSALVMNDSPLNFEAMRLALLGVAVVHLVARVALVAGIVGLLSELPRPVKSPGSESFGG